MEDLPFDRTATFGSCVCSGIPVLGQNCNFGSCVHSGRPAFGQNCNLGSCVCSEIPVLGQNCNLGSCVCSGRPAFGQNCNLSSCVCSERPALGQNTLLLLLLLLMMMYNCICWMVVTNTAYCSFIFVWFTLKYRYSNNLLIFQYLKLWNIKYYWKIIIKLR